MVTNWIEYEFAALVEAGAGRRPFMRSRGPCTIGEQAGRSSLAFAPAGAQVEGRGLGAAVAGEDTLLVAVDAEDTRRGGEVGEAPDLFAHHGVDPVEDTVIHVEQLGLVLLGPWAGQDAAESGIRVGAVLGDDDGLVVYRRPLPQL